MRNQVVINRKLVNIKGNGFRKVEQMKNNKDESLYDDFLNKKTIKSIKITGGSIEGIDQIRNKMESLKIKPKKELKNIKFSI